MSAPVAWMIEYPSKTGGSHYYFSCHDSIANYRFLYPTALSTALYTQSIVDAQQARIDKLERELAELRAKVWI